MNQRTLAVADFGLSFGAGLLYPTQVNQLQLAYGGQAPSIIGFMPPVALTRGGLAAGAKVGTVLEESQLRTYNQLLIDKLLEWSENVGVWNNVRSIDASKKLRDNMRDAGIIPAMMANAAHHIMPAIDRWENPLAQRARAILQQFGIGPEHPANGVLLRRLESGWGAPHGVKGEPDIHTVGYIEYVSQKIINAEEGGKEEVINALQRVGNELQEGKVIW